MHRHFHGHYSRRSKSHSLHSNLMISDCYMHWPGLMSSVLRHQVGSARCFRSKGIYNWHWGKPEEDPSSANMSPLESSTDPGVQVTQKLKSTQGKPQCQTPHSCRDCQTPLPAVVWRSHYFWYTLPVSDSVQVRAFIQFHSHPPSSLSMGSKYQHSYVPTDVHKHLKK